MDAPKDPSERSGIMLGIHPREAIFERPETVAGLQPVSLVRPRFHPVESLS